MSKLAQTLSKVIKQSWWHWLIIFAVALIIMIVCQQSYAADPFAAAKAPLKESIGTGSTVQWGIGGVAAVYAAYHAIVSKDIGGAAFRFVGTEGILQVASLVAGLT